MKYNDDFWAVEACLHGKREQVSEALPVIQAIAPHNSL